MDGTQDEDEVVCVSSKSYSDDSHTSVASASTASSTADAMSTADDANSQGSACASGQLPPGPGAASSGEDGSVVTGEDEMMDSIGDNISDGYGEDVDGGGCEASSIGTSHSEIETNLNDPLGGGADSAVPRRLPGQAGSDHPDQVVRPRDTFMNIIGKAIMSSQTEMMVLTEIYDYIKSNYKYYGEANKPAWQNAVRHNLSLHRDCFVKVPRYRVQAPTTSCYWKLTERARDLYMVGESLKKAVTHHRKRRRHGRSASPAVVDLRHNSVAMSNEAPYKVPAPRYVHTNGGRRLEQPAATHSQAVSHHLGTRQPWMVAPGHMHTPMSRPSPLTLTQSIPGQTPPMRPTMRHGGVPMAASTRAAPAAAAADGRHGLSREPAALSRRAREMDHRLASRLSVQATRRDGSFYAFNPRSGVGRYAIDNSTGRAVALAGVFSSDERLFGWWNSGCDVRNAKTIIAEMQDEMELVYESVLRYSTHHIQRKRQRAAERWASHDRRASRQDTGSTAGNSRRSRHGSPAPMMARPTLSYRSATPPTDDAALLIHTEHAASAGLATRPATVIDLSNDVRERQVKREDAHSPMPFLSQADADERDAALASHHTHHWPRDHHTHYQHAQAAAYAQQAAAGRQSSGRTLSFSTQAMDHRRQAAYDGRGSMRGPTSTTHYVIAGQHMRSSSHSPPRRDREVTASPLTMSSQSSPRHPAHRRDRSPSPHRPYRDAATFRAQHCERNTGAWSD